MAITVLNDRIELTSLFVDTSALQEGTQSVASDFY